MLEFWQDHPAWWVATAVLLGLCVGSFLNVVIHRLPQMMERSWREQCAELCAEADTVQTASTQAASTQTAATQISAQPTAEPSPLNLLHPRSRCPQCGHQLGALENIPVFSWLALRGRCSACKTRISARYPLVEITAAALAGFAAAHWGVSLAALGATVLLWALLTLALIDADTQFLPDDITLPLLWLGLLLNWQGVYTALPDAVLGAAVGYASLWTLFWVFKLLTGKEGMGYGDFKLLAALGAWLGWQMLPVIILLSSLVGAVVGLALIVFGAHQRGKPIPFGPYLAGAGALALFFGADLNRWYLGVW